MRSFWTYLLPNGFGLPPHAPARPCRLAGRDGALSRAAPGHRVTCGPQRWRACTVEPGPQGGRWVSRVAPAPARCAAFPAPWLPRGNRTGQIPAKPARRSGLITELRITAEIPCGYDVDNFRHNQKFRDQRRYAVTDGASGGCQSSGVPVVRRRRRGRTGRYSAVPPGRRRLFDRAARRAAQVRSGRAERTSAARRRFPVLPRRCRFGPGSRRCRGSNHVDPVPQGRSLPGHSAASRGSWTGSPRGAGRRRPEPTRRR